MTPQERVTLADAFDESLLPIKVDVVELESVDREFRERIERDFVVVQGYSGAFVDRAWTGTLEPAFRFQSAGCQFGPLRL